MGAAMEVITGRAVNPSSTFTAVTMGTGDSNAIRNFLPGQSAFLTDFWALGATKGNVRIRSPRLHDNVQGIKASYAAATPVSVYNEWCQELLYAQDSLTIELTGDAADTDMTSLLIYYTDLPGAAARLYSWEAIEPRIQHVMGTEVDITTGGTKGDYGGAVAINATFDQFKANQDYAILGYVTDTAMCTVGVRSADFGNLRVGGPGTNNKLDTRDYFIRMSKQNGVPMIPVFNAANKAGTLVDVVHNTTATAVTVTFLCAQLS